MPNKENDNSQNHHSDYLHADNESSMKYESKNNWSPNVEKELLIELKPTMRKGKKTYDFGLKFSCVLVVILALLSIGMCLQANAIIDALRVIARTSVHQMIRINNP